MENPDKRIQTKMQEYTDNHYQKKETCPTSFVLSGACQDIFHSKWKSMFHTVDAFMFCTMIHKGTLNILHS
jgi:hypothetical protein